MIVQCPSCEARYRIGAENIPPQGGKITCPTCSQSFIVYPEAATQTHNELNDDVTRASNLKHLAQMHQDLNADEDGTVEIQNPIKTWLESQKREANEEASKAETSVLPADLDSFGELDDKTEMIDLGDFLDLDAGSEELDDKTEVLTLEDLDVDDRLGSTMNLDPAAKATHHLPIPNTQLPPLGSLGAQPGRAPLPAPKPKPTLPPSLGNPVPSLLAEPRPQTPTQGNAHPLGTPTSSPSALPPLNPGPARGNRPQSLPGFEPAQETTQPVAAIAPVMVNDPEPSIEFSASSIYPPTPQTTADYAGPWKLRTNFGLTYEFPDTESLNAWVGTRDDTSGYTLAGNGEFLPLTEYPHIRPKYAGTSGSFSIAPADIPHYNPNQSQPPSGAPIPGELPPVQAPYDASPSSAPSTPAQQHMQHGELPLTATPPAAAVPSTGISTGKKSILVLLAWLFCGFSAFVTILTALYVFGFLGNLIPSTILSPHFSQLLLNL